MRIDRLATDFAVTEQLRPSDLAEVATAGFRTIVCNRPDGEAGGQPSFAEVTDAARAAGLTAAYVPVPSGAKPGPYANEFRTVFAAAQKPVLAYCRSGARSTALWKAAFTAEPYQSGGGI